MANPLAAAATNTDMKWAFPTMENPTIIDLNTTGGQDWWQFRPDEDVIFIGADSPRTASKLQTDGGRNIVLLGGEYQPSGDSKSATLHFLNLYGSVHVEGVHIDSKNSAQDGIAVAGASGHQPNVTVQNTLIENVHGVSEGIHGDVFQTHGSVGDMRFYNVTGSTNYQGFFIAPQYDPAHKSADFENVNMKWIPGGQPISYQYWFLDSPQETAYPITLKNVYATERSGQTAEEASVWPKASLGDKTHSVRVGDQITWPDLPYKGSITVGAPAHDFATSAKVGLNYHVDGLKATTGTTTTTTTPATPEAPHDVPATATGPAAAADPDGVGHASAAPANWVQSTDAAAQIHGTEGNDQIAGVAGKVDAHLAGGAGDDTYIVDQAGDHVIETAGQGVDTVLSYAKGYTLSANVENLTLGGTGDHAGTGNGMANRIIGSDGNNVLDGRAGDDLLVGGQGNDVLNGGLGADVMAGGTGNDTYVVSRATDKVVELSGQGVDTVKSGVTYTLQQFQENLVLFGDARDGTGTGWHNRITGNDLDNHLDGKGGNDVLTGGKGADVLTGGSGKDTFVYHSAAEGGDTIKDFKIGQDTLDVRDLVKSLGSASHAPIADHVLAVVQQGEHAVVTVAQTGSKVVTVEHVDAHQLASTIDHWNG